MIDNIIMAPWMMRRMHALDSDPWQRALYAFNVGMRGFELIAFAAGQGKEKIAAEVWKRRPWEVILRPAADGTTSTSWTNAPGCAPGGWKDAETKQAAYRFLYGGHAGGEADTEARQWDKKTPDEIMAELNAMLALRDRGEATLHRMMIEGEGDA